MTRSAILVSTLHMISLRLIGQLVALVSGLLISSRFGVTDDYYSALILPAALANLAVNILTNLFTPIYLEYIHRDPTQQQPILDSLVPLLGTALILGSLIAAAAVPLSIRLRGISAAPPSLIFGFALILITPMLGFSRLLGLICEAHQHYRLPAAAALLNPLIFVTLLCLLTPHIGVYSLLIANLSGQLAELLLLLSYVKLRLSIRFGIRLRLHPAVREMIKLAPALTYTALFFVPTFDRLAASSVAPGALTAFHYGERLVTAADLLITTSAITTISNQWAIRHAHSGIDAAARSYTEAISTLLFALVPLALSGWALSRPLISILFEHGAFTESVATAQVFALLLLSAPLNYLIILNVRLLLIVRDVQAQVILALGIAGLNTLFNWILTPRFGLSGIACSTSHFAHHHLRRKLCICPSPAAPA